MTSNDRLFTLFSSLTFWGAAGILFFRLFFGFNFWILLLIWGLITLGFYIKELGNEGTLQAIIEKKEVKLYDTLKRQADVQNWINKMYKHLDTLEKDGFAHKDYLRQIDISQGRLKELNSQIEALKTEIKAMKEVLAV